MQARFFEHATGIVKIKINAGETLHHVSGGATDEGYSWEAKEYHFDGETLTCQWSTDARDCDGRMTRSGVSVCRADRLQAGWHDAENGVRFPDWASHDERQRDYSAEAAGY